MISFRRAQALLAALVLLAIFLLLHSSSSQPPIPTVEELGHYKPRSFSSSAAYSAKPFYESSHSSSDTPLSSTLKTAPKGPKQQITLADLSNKPLRQQLALQFPYDPEEKFPAYIWQTWVVTPSSGEFPQDWRPFEASWTELHPGFVHEVIDDASSHSVLQHLYANVPDVVEAYEALPKAVLKADFFRYLILLARGGIYSDIDTTALKAAYEWVPDSVPRSSYGLVIGIEADPDREDWHDWYARRVQFCQWTIQSKPGHPILREIVAHITDEALKRKRSKTGSKIPLDDEVMELTGPGIWTDTIFNFFNDPEYFDTASTKSGNITWRQFTGMTQTKKVGDVLVLPITSFSPGVGHSGAGDIDDPMAFVHHQFEGSWKPESERHIGSGTNNE